MRIITSIPDQRSDNCFLQTKVLKVYGLSEAEVDTRLQGAINTGSGVTLAFGVEFPEIHVKLRAGGDDELSVAEAMKSTIDRVRERLGDFIFGEDEDTIDSVVAGVFRKRKLTLSLAESCTGGLLAKRITDMPGSSEYFVEGAVTYSDKAKTRALGVSRKILEDHGAVSAETAIAMAEGIRIISGSDLALAVTGIAGPDGGSKEKPVGTVFIALADSSGCHTREYRLSGSRDEIRLVTAFSALDWLRRYLLI